MYSVQCTLHTAPGVQWQWHYRASTVLHNVQVYSGQWEGGVYREEWLFVHYTHCTLSGVEGGNITQSPRGHRGGQRKGRRGGKKKTHHEVFMLLLEIFV